MNWFILFGSYKSGTDSDIVFVECELCKMKTNNTVPYMKILYFQRTCILYSQHNFGQYNV